MIHHMIFHVLAALKKCSEIEDQTQKDQRGRTLKKKKRRKKKKELEGKNDGP